ncbi:hypothetical protein AMJ51_00810 [Microgenomates bacterium DG_75]|nr:MAG: hypothetical protein AMJ51_00810 [Microgenomates bacterium DG_75]
MFEKEKERKEKPFEGKKVYFSASIRGAKVDGRQLLWDLVEFMEEEGADVLSKHVAARNKEERDRIFYERSGIRVDVVEDPKGVIREIDLAWVDEAAYVVAEVTATSMGVGMEIQRAIDKDEMGLNHTKILCLYRRDIISEDRASSMVFGVRPKEHKDYYLVGYTSLEEAKEVVARFLTDKLGRGDISTFSALLPLGGQVIKYTRDGGETWRYARLFSNPERFSNGSLGFVADEEISPRGIHHRGILADRDFEKGLIVREVEAKEIEGKRFSFEDKLPVT